jgi:hypothetical protein
VVAIFISLRAEHELSPGEVLNVRFTGKLGACCDRPQLADTVEKVEISVSLKFR